MLRSQPNQWGLMLDAAWRALAYCLHPRVIYLSVLPLLLAAVSLGVLGWWGWADGVAAVRAWLDNWGISHDLLQWLDRAGLSALRAALVPLLLVIMTVPIVIIVCLLLVAGLMTPALVKLVKARRFPALQGAQATPWWASLLWSLGASVLAMLMLLASLPLWLLPVMAVLLPPLIWGWLTYRVLAFDTLADLATSSERQQVLKQHRGTLLVMGVVCGYMGAAPAALWALGAWTVVLAPLLIVASVWLYTLVFAFSSLWFAHYLLPALQALRQSDAAGAAQPAVIDDVTKVQP